MSTAIDSKFTSDKRTEEELTKFLLDLGEKINIDIFALYKTKEKELVNAITILIGKEKERLIQEKPVGIAVQGLVNRTNSESVLEGSNLQLT